MKSGLRFNRDYTVDIEDGWNLDNMKAVAFITRPIEDDLSMELFDINNATAVSLKDIAVDAISNIQSDNMKDGKVYDMSGRQVNGQLKAGVYLQNGKKFIVK